MRGRVRVGEMSVARQILLLQVVVVLVLVVASVGLAALDARRDAREDAAGRAVTVAEAIADSPAVLDSLASPDPSAGLQPYAEQVRADTDTDFVVVMAPDRTRYTHPDPTKIGRAFVGDLGGALEGRVFTQQYTGSLGPSVRAVVPVFDAGAVVALVSVGITVAAINDQVRGDVLLISLAALAVLLAGLVGAGLVSGRLRRQTHGLGEGEITRMYEYYSAVLHAVREGLVLLDADGVVQLVNDEARRLLDLPADVVGRSIHDLGLAPALVETALGADAAPDDLYVAGDRVLVVSSSPAAWAGREVGAVVTLRDSTELRAVTGELDVVRGLTDSLRAQSHEAANRLHTVVSLIEMGRADEAVEFVTGELHLAQLLTDRVVGAGGDPIVTALLLGKSAEAAERGIELVIDLGGHDDLPPPSVVSPRDLLTVLGNLIDNAFDAVSDTTPKTVRLRVEQHDDHVVLQVDDSGPGLSEQAARHALERGWTTKAAVGEARQGGRGIGLALVAQTARRLGGEVRIARSALGGAAMIVTMRAASSSTSTGVDEVAR